MPGAASIPLSAAGRASSRSSWVTAMSPMLSSRDARPLTDTGPVQRWPPVAVPAPWALVAGPHVWDGRRPLEPSDTRSLGSRAL